MIYVYLAEGFEETEAITPIDLLRRAGKNVVTVGVGDNIVKGSHGIPVITDTIVQEAPLSDELEMIVLPGGMPGTLNLEKNEYVRRAIEYCHENNRVIGAICAAPSILGHMNILQGRKAVCYTGFEKELYGAEIADGTVSVDGNIVTSRGAGTAMDFALALVEKAVSKEESQRQASAVIYR